MNEELTVVDYADYVMGKKFNEGKYERRIDVNNVDVFEQYFQLEETYPELKIVLESTEVYSVFKKCIPDIAKKVPNALLEEMFWAVKAGVISPIVPSKCIFLLRKAFEVRQSVNFAWQCLPKGDVTKMFEQGYVTEVNGVRYTLYDVIKTFVDEDYEPLTLGNPAVKRADGFYDVYIKDTNMIAIMHESMVKNLSVEDILNIKLEDNCLMLNGRPVKELGSLLGVSNNIYDLRDTI